MVIIFDFRTFINIKSHSHKHVNNFIFDRCQWMKVSCKTCFCRKSYVYFFIIITSHHCFFIDFFFLFIVKSLCPVLYVIYSLSVSFLFFVRNLFNSTHKLLDFSTFTEIFSPESCKLFRIFNQI